MLYENGVIISNEQILQLFKKNTENLLIEQYGYCNLYHFVKKIRIKPPP